MSCLNQSYIFCMLLSHTLPRVCAFLRCREEPRRTQRRTLRAVYVAGGSDRDLRAVLLLLLLLLWSGVSIPAIAGKISPLRPSFRFFVLFCCELEHPTFVWSYVFVAH